jgi:hypothetical protein
MSHVDSHSIVIIVTREQPKELNAHALPLATIEIVLSIIASGIAKTLVRRTSIS